MGNGKIVDVRKEIHLQCHCNGSFLVSNAHLLLLLLLFKNKNNETEPMLPYKGRKKEKNKLCIERAIFYAIIKMNVKTEQ